MQRARRRDKVQLKGCKTALLHKSVLGMGPTIFNNLPDKIRQAPDILTFKRNLYNFLVDKAFYSINEYLANNN